MRALVVLAACGCAPATGELVAPVVTTSRVPASLVLAVAPRLAASADRPLTAADPADDELLPALSLVVACALGSDDVITVGGVDLFGELGVARGWRRHAIGRAARERVTGCVLARAGGRDVLTVVSLSGDRLRRDPDFARLEGSFFGDLFRSTPTVAACAGPSQAPDRVCALLDDARPGLTRCGFVFAGSCDDACDGDDCDGFEATSAWSR